MLSEPQLGELEARRATRIEFKTLLDGTLSSPELGALEEALFDRFYRTGLGTRAETGGN